MKTIILCLILSTIASANENGGGIIYYGSSDAVLPAKNQEMFLMGFELGLEQRISKDQVKKLLVVNQDNSGNPLGAIQVAKNIFNASPSLVVGFPTSHEALLVAKEYGKHGTLIIFAGAGHSDLAKFGNTVHTTGESMEYAIDCELNFIMRKFGTKKGAIIGNPYAVFSKNHDEFLFQQLGQRPVKPNLKFFGLTQDKKLSEADAKQLVVGGFGYLVLSPYADECVQLLAQLDELKIDLPIVANSSWTTGDVDYLRRLLSKKSAPVYAAALWLAGSAPSKRFETLVRERFGREATSEIAYGFDLGCIVGQIITLARGDYSKENILKVFLKKRCFDDLASGEICFQLNGGHAIRHLAFVQLTNKGFVPVR